MESQSRSPRRMVPLAGLLALVLALALTSCGSSEAVPTTYEVDDTLATPTTQPRGDGRVLIDQVGPLEPGDYLVHWNAYDLSFRLVGQWRMDMNNATAFRLNAPDLVPTGNIQLQIGLLEDAVVATDVMRGVVYSEPENLEPAPPDLARWFTGLPYVEALATEPIEMSGLTGVQVLSRVGDVPLTPSRELCPPGPADCLVWVMYGEGGPNGFPVTEGDTILTVFLDGPTAPIVIQVHGHLAGTTVDELRQELAPVYDVLASMELHGRDD